MLDKDDFIRIGIVQKTFGTEGAYIVKLSQSSVSEFLKLESVFLDVEGNLVPFFILHAEQKGKDKVLVQFKELWSEKRALEFLGAELYAGQDDIIDLDDDENQSYYAYLGFELIDSDSKCLLGKVKEIIEYPNNSLFLISTSGEDKLLPIADDLMQSVDLKKKCILYSLPEGLLEL